ncbi:MAG: hypothetical protein R6X09_03690 [Bacteroidales bacterium]
MKNSISILFAAILFICLFVSCKKDDDQSNYLRCDKDRSDLVNGSLIKLGLEPNIEGCLYYLHLCSSGVTVDNYGYFSGSGSVFGAYFVSPSLIGVETGNYNLDETNPKAFFTYNNATAIMDWSSGAMIQASFLTSGVIRVKKIKSNVYEFVIEGENSFGEKVSGYFKGELLYLPVAPIAK